MKRLFFSGVALIAVLFLMSCGGNPAETPAYKALVSQLDSVKTQYMTAVEGVGALATGFDQMKQQVAALPAPDSVLTAWSAAADQAVAGVNALKEKQTQMVAAQDEILKNHLTGGMKLEQMTADFDKIKGEYAQMEQELAGAKQSLEQLKGAYDSRVLAMKEAAAAPTAPAKK